MPTIKPEEPVRGAPDSARIPSAVLFDFDLTLADSTDSILRCFAHACRAVGHPVPADEVIRALIGMPLAGMWRRIARDRTTARAHEEAFVYAYRERAAVHMTAETQLFPGVPETLAALADAGIGLGLVSTKIRVRVDDVLVHRGVRERFGVVLGGDDVTCTKPAPDGVRIAIERLGVAPGEAIYVGDSAIDAETAQRAGTGFVAVTTGATPRSAFAPFACLAILDRLTELPGLLGLLAVPPST